MLLSKSCSNLQNVSRVSIAMKRNALRRANIHVPINTFCCLNLENKSEVNYKQMTSLSTQHDDDSLASLILKGSKLTSVTQLIWSDVVKKGDLVVDGTCGNGKDTLALANLVFHSEPNPEPNYGTVIGFDLQEAAIANTSELLSNHLLPSQMEQITLHRCCHSKMDDYVLPNSAKLIVFNLGYLPRGNKEVVTQSQTTILALEAATNLLASHGLISILCYVGHPGGLEEYENVRDFAMSLPSLHWSCNVLERVNHIMSVKLVTIYKI